MDRVLERLLNSFYTGGLPLLVSNLSVETKWDCYGPHGMRLGEPFGRLQIEVDVDEIVAEVDRLDPSSWRPHPEGHSGNDALPLVSANGSVDDDSVDGDMRPTPVLERLPSLLPVFAALDAPIGRTRMMRIVPGGEATAHVDLNRYWWDRHRVHIPLRTDPSVEFRCGDAGIHMPAGSVWVFDTWRKHNVINGSSAERIHLVIDTVGSEALTALLDDAQPIRRIDGANSATPRFEHAEPPGPIALESLRATMTALIADLEDQGHAPALRAAADALVDQWSKHPSAEALAAFTFDTSALGDTQLLNGTELSRAIRHLVISPAWRDDHGRQVGLRLLDGTTRQSAPSPVPAVSPSSTPREPLFERPVIVVCPPRSGSTLLFELLATSPQAWTIGGESHALVEGQPSLHPAAREFDSNRLDATAATSDVIARLHAEFSAKVVDRDGHRPNADTRRLRLVEKTPKNALRVPFLDAVFPDAHYVHLVRDPREEIASMIDAWASGRFITYPQLPGWEGPPWSLVLTPGWRDLRSRPLPEVAARQWASATTILLDDLERIDADRVTLVRYSDLVDDPQATMTSVCEATGLSWDRQLQPGQLPAARHTLTPPDPDKWRRHWPDIEPLLGASDEVRKAFDRVNALLDHGRPPAVSPPRSRPSSVAPSRATEADRASEPFHSVHTPAMPALLERAGITLLVSTYQSGRLIALRNDNGVVNTHFRFLARPMGVAVGPERLAVGTQREIIEYRNQPAVAANLEPAGTHDACYLPLRRHVTGDISIHDMAYGANGELWFVNTRFSCLATLDAEHSFVPRWRPRFISALAAEDRCHLNGLAMVAGSPAFVTAFGTSDEARGWRTGKADGGLVIDVASNEIVAGGLAMPHSPRWHDGCLWVLESGRGRVGVVDLASGRIDTVAELPGFTRGLAFVGKYALVGLSQVRETVFDGLPLTQRAEPRRCGVWIIDTSTGQTVGFLQFEGSVREVFDVQVLDARMPEILELDDALLGGSFVLPAAT
jgi:uncharacterized protein (TIGR03032 family)